MSGRVYGFTTTPYPSWGATTRQVRVIVAAPSRAAAARACKEFGVPVSVWFLSTYAEVTSNDAECEAALAQPGVVLFASEGGVCTAADFRRLP